MNIDKQYSKLLLTKRNRSSTYSGRDLITEAESDRARLIFCPAFRRLQQKAQVFSMEPNAAVRSRLTHSLEVSQVGRYIAELIVKRLKDTHQVSELNGIAIVKFVENACLMHDIGNPPFGHFGEAAISKWFEDNGSRIVRTACKLQPLEDASPEENDPIVLEALYDFYSFDGNPQGLRVTSKLQRNSDEHGLNLTFATIASYLKYVRGSNPQKSPHPFTKKCGYFNTEASLVTQLWKCLDFEKPQRYPLAYIMEAADDLAYCISDLEDSIEKGLLIQKNAIQEIRKLWAEKCGADLDSTNESIAKKIDEYLEYLLNQKKGDQDFTFIDFRTSINRDIAEYAASEYILHHEKILSGTLPALIPASSAYGKFLDLLKEYCRKYVYSHESVQIIELAGYRAIYGLLDHFKCLLECEHERFQIALDYDKNKDHNENKIVIEKKLLRLFPKNYIKVYWDDLKNSPKDPVEYRLFEWNIRAHLIVDFISGMTDDFSMDTYRELSGMKL